ncbi:Xylose isomerase-like, TIM barrel-containing protein domain-containing protein [Rhodotorula toruloides]|uniref:Xylose isomerase-like, TIM barrel-containing protein domain-containing protein n=1 Tax=Rhodotorula toruloides TaxID=5286 RepID=A0A2T0ACE7_RHOTO|nr:Xylose isomerase-like, TIM barrel-containing protein domain-containing protein [Rhodotorula toruloides]
MVLRLDALRLCRPSHPLRSPSTRLPRSTTTTMASDTCSSAPNSLPSTPPALASPPTTLFPPVPVPLGIASLSLGSCESHSLASKIRSAAEQGFANIELFDLDWQDFRDRFARENGYAVPCKEGDEASRAAAREVARLCRDAGVEISCWQPLRTFEGWVDEDDEREAREYAKGILDILPLLGTDLVLCCSTTAPASRTTPSLDKAVSDLRWLADLAATYSPPIRIMYEGLSFGTHRRSWQDVWEVVERADRPNLGICLDSFNTLALEWASPYTRSGRLSDDVDDKLEKNMRELVRRVPGDKVRPALPLLHALPSDPPFRRSSSTKSPTPVSCPLPSRLPPTPPSPPSVPGRVPTASSPSSTPSAHTSPSSVSLMRSCARGTRERGVSRCSMIV